MNDPCINCGERPASREGGWMLCEPCWQDQCEEVEQARAGMYDEPDAIGRLMIDEGLDFMSAVERLAKERGLWPS